MLTISKKIVEYLTNLWYSYHKKNKKNKRGTKMNDLIVKKIYQEADILEKKDSKILAFLRKMYYIASLKMMSRKIDYNNYLEKNKDICNGEYVIKGTRIKPITIYIEFYSLLSNSSITDTDTDKILKQLNEEYPAITEESILISLLYCVKKYGFKKMFNL